MTEQGLNLIRTCSLSGKCPVSLKTRDAWFFVASEVQTTVCAEYGTNQFNVMLHQKTFGKA